MAGSATPAAELDALGKATEAVQRQLATVSEARRSWIAGQASDGSKQTWRLAPVDLYPVNAAVLPESLVPDAGRMSPSSRELADQHAVLAAIADPDRQPQKVANDPMPRDHVALRRSRPVTVGVYTRDPSAGWTLDDKSLRALDVVDEFCPIDPLSLDGSWWRMKKFELSYHPDMSLKTFGISSTSSLAGVATSTGDLFDALGQARKDIAARPSADEKERDRAKVQFELLQASSQYEVLAATRYRSAELAVLEQQKKLREAAS
jgi:hypothetical protein